jgi:hypothetical protein
VSEPGLSVDDVASFLRGRTPSQLIKILAPILAEKARDESPLEHRFALCEFTRCADSTLADTAWECAMIGTAPSDEDWSAFESQGYWESGTCGRCGVGVASYAKTALCPLCGKHVHLT